MTTIVYEKKYYLGPKIEFTPTGHVDMDVFDEGGSTYVDVLAEFHDEEAERLCRPVLEGLEDVYNRRNKAEPEADEVWVERVIQHEPEPNKLSDYGPHFFWNDFLDVSNGFFPSEFDWDEEDNEGKPYDWDTEELFKQVPKYKDFLKVCQHEIANEMEWATKDLTDFSVDEAYRIVLDKVSMFLKMSRCMYQQEFDWENMMMRETA